MAFGACMSTFRSLKTALRPLLERLHLAGAAFEYFNCQFHSPAGRRMDNRNMCSKIGASLKTMKDMPVASHPFSEKMKKLRSEFEMTPDPERKPPFVISDFTDEAPEEVKAETSRISLVLCKPFSAHHLRRKEKHTCAFDLLRRLHNLN